jgi:hypothetical protein
MRHICFCKEKAARVLLKILGATINLITRATRPGNSCTVELTSYRDRICTEVPFLWNVTLPRFLSSRIPLSLKISTRPCDFLLTQRRVPEGRQSQLQRCRNLETGKFVYFTQTLLTNVHLDFSDDNELTLPSPTY